MPTKKPSSPHPSGNNALIPIPGVSRTAVLAIITLAATLGVYAVSHTFAATGRPDIVDVANNYIGTHEGTKGGGPSDCNCGGGTGSGSSWKYNGNVEKFTGGPNQPWCADFVSYVYKLSGHSIGHIARAQGLEDYFRNHSKWHGRSATPEKGDVIVFNYDGGNDDHTGIVDYVEGSTVHTIEGNSSNAVHRRSYNRSNSTIAGYGRL